MTDIALHTCIAVNETDESLGVVALLDLIDLRYCLCIRGITADAPNGIRRIEDHPTLTHRLYCILDIFFSCHT